MKNTDGRDEIDMTDSDCVDKRPPLPSDCSPEFELGDYWREGDDLDLTAEEAAIVLGALWEAMKLCVDIGFDVGSLHSLFAGLADGDDTGKENKNNDE